MKTFFPIVFISRCFGLVRFELINVIPPHEVRKMHLIARARKLDWYSSITTNEVDSLIQSDSMSPSLVTDLENEDFRVTINEYLDLE